jgi:hypothetical protein
MCYFMLGIALLCASFALPQMFICPVVKFKAVCATSPWGIEDVAQIFGDLNPATGIPEYITLGS